MTLHGAVDLRGQRIAEARSSWDAECMPLKKVDRGPVSAFGSEELASCNEPDRLGMGGAPFAHSFDELACFDTCAVLKDGILSSVLASAGKIGVAHTFR